MFSGGKSIHHRSVVKIAEFRIKAMHRGHHLAPLYKINAFMPADQRMAYISQRSFYITDMYEMDGEMKG